MEAHAPPTRVFDWLPHTGRLISNTGAWRCPFIPFLPSFVSFSLAFFHHSLFLIHFGWL